MMAVTVPRFRSREGEAIQHVSPFRVEARITNHLRVYVLDLEKYKAIQFLFM